MDDEYNQEAVERVALECGLGAGQVERVLHLYGYLQGAPDACICAAWYPHECACYASWEDE